MSLQGLDALVPPGFDQFLLKGHNPFMADNIGQQTSTTTLFTKYRIPDAEERAFIKALIREKKTVHSLIKQESDELDMAAIIREMDKPEDIFQREELWIQAGGDCLFSEFEKPVLPSDNMPVEAPVWINLFIVGSIFFFMIRFFLFIYP